jgi:hypothetical protein
MLPCLVSEKNRWDILEKSEISTPILSEITEALMEDKRRLKRTRIRRNASIIVSGSEPIMHCTVRDVTNKGARLSVAFSSGLPTVFQLSFDSCRSMRQCRMIWAGQHEVGVVFFTDA